MQVSPPHCPSRRVGLTGGFSLVEVTMAIGLMSYCLVAMLGLASVGLQQERQSTDQLLALEVLSAVAADFRSIPTGQTHSTAYGIQLPAIGASATEGSIGLDENFQIAAMDQRFKVTYAVEAPASRFANYRLFLRIQRTAPGAGDKTLGSPVESVAMKAAM